VELPLFALNKSRGIERRGVFEGLRTAIETESGEVIEERTDPVAAYSL